MSKKCWPGGILCKQRNGQLTHIKSVAEGVGTWIYPVHTIKDTPNTSNKSLSRLILQYNRIWLDPLSRLQSVLLMRHISH